MNTKIVQSSILLAELAEKKKKTCASIYPFEDLECGQSFTEPLDHLKLNSLRSIVSRRNKKQDKFFVVAVHEDLNLIEVGRVE